MVEFVTLFLGLVFGPQSVEVSVGETVAKVEILLDGESLATLEGTPWSGICDFGELAPRRLEAVARNAAGDEVGRTFQWLNMPSHRAEARLSIEPREQGPTRARLAWEALDHERPDEVRLALDGRPFAVADPSSFELPEHDPASLHFLRAELSFPNRVGVTAELVFGGTFGDTVATELTAVPVSFEGRRAPKAGSMEGWLRVRGKSPRVVGVEKGAADVLVVRDRSPLNMETLRELSRWRNARAGTATPLMAPMAAGSRLRFAFPATLERARQGRSLHLSPISRDVAGLLGGSLFRILTETTFDDFEPGEDQALADAVAIAGLVAAGGNRRRAVVLVSSSLEEDLSTLTLDAARAYLAHLRVPFFAWSPVAEAADSDFVDISKPGGFTRAAEVLRESLEQQLIVWVEGAYLPGEVELTPRAKGLSLPQ